MVFLAISQLHNSSYTSSGGCLYRHHLSGLNLRSRQGAGSGTRRDINTTIEFPESVKERSNAGVSPELGPWGYLPTCSCFVGSRRYGKGWWRAWMRTRGSKITMVFQGFVFTLNVDGGRKKVAAAICPGMQVPIDEWWYGPENTPQLGRIIIYDGNEGIKEIDII